MCGIAGGWHIGPEAVSDMLSRLKHRGPDQTDIVTLGDVCLGANRLRLYGQEMGQQPISDGRSGLVYQGEIYNHADLTEPPTDSDSLSLFRYLAADGDHFDTFNGQFAFAFYDGAQLRLVRDYPGIVPLFYAVDNGCLAFASERDALHAIGFERCFSLEPGACLHYAGQAPNCESWWVSCALDLGPDPVDTLDALLRDAVATRVTHRDPDVKVGVFLSGGVDSSLVAALARQVHPVRAFVFDGRDTEAAMRVIRFLGLDYTLVQAGAEELRAAASLLDRELGYEGFDELVRALFAVTYLLARQARREGYRILLSGEGSDELFAGYELYDLYPGSVNAIMPEIIDHLHRFSLERMDVSCMLNSVESRPPYLDPRVINFALTLPEAYMRRDGWEKWIVRRVAERYLPAEVAWAEKSPMQISTGSYEALYGRAWKWKAYY